MRRDSAWADRLRAYRIELDGVEVARLKRRQTATCEIAPGPHIIQAKIDWCGSGPLLLLVDSRDVVVNVKSGLRGWRSLRASFAAFFDRSGWIELEVVEPEKPSALPPSRGGG